MWLFHKIIRLLYVYARIACINIRPYPFLFNKPKRKVYSSILETIHADILFTEKERRLIYAAANDITNFTNNIIQFEFKFDVIDYSFFHDKSILIKVLSSNEKIKQSDLEHASKTIGLCAWRRNLTKELYLVDDRLSHSSNLFRTTLAHELGHFIGLSHIDKKGLMHPINNQLSPHPNYYDAMHLAHFWKCDPNDLAYFK